VHEILSVGCWVIVGQPLEAIKILEDTLELFSQKQFPERYGRIKVSSSN
jgi:hypothetical protein